MVPLLFSPTALITPPVFYFIFYFTAARPSSPLVGPQPHLGRLLLLLLFAQISLNPSRLEKSRREESSRRGMICEPSEDERTVPKTRWPTAAAALACVLIICTPEKRGKLTCAIGPHMTPFTEE